MEKSNAEIIAEWMRSPFLFIKNNWGLIPQPPLPENAEKIKEIPPEKWKAEFFGIRGEKGWEWHEFRKGVHITWMQVAIITAVEEAVQAFLLGKISEVEFLRRISVCSGHGIGKSATFAWLLLWFLFCFPNAQIPCTAPTRDQMYDILWKEVQLWHGRIKMPSVKNAIEITNDRVQMRGAEKSWFARARTGSKENPEALAGIHSDWVMTLVDEASGVADAVYTTAEGALTGPFALMLMISNPTRLLGYFYDSHHSDKKAWRRFVFDCEDSPIVDVGYVQRIEEKYGRDSDEFRVRVQGKFPKIDGLDEQGYAPLFVESDIRETESAFFVGKKRMGVDPAGEGKDTTDWVVRDQFRAKVVASEKISTPKSIAQKTLTLMAEYGILPGDVFVDNFGAGANVAQELALSGKAVKAVNMGDVYAKGEEDAERYLNKRAGCSWKVREWLRSGAELVKHKNWKQLLGIRYISNLRGKIQIMSKKEMRKRGIDSPNTWDALTLTFFEEWAEEVREDPRDLRKLQREIEEIDLADVNEW